MRRAMINKIHDPRTKAKMLNFRFDTVCNKLL